MSAVFATRDQAPDRREGFVLRVLCWVGLLALTMLTVEGCTMNAPFSSPPAGTLSVSSTSLNFGSVQVGSTKGMPLTLNNSGTQSATIQVSQIVASGEGFKVAGTTSPFSLAANTSTTVTVDFSPATSGSSSGSLLVISTATNPSVSVPLSGSGLGPGQLGISPGTMNFPNVTVGTSQSQTGTLVAGSSDITVSSATWSGAGFALSGIAFPVTVPAGKSVPFTATFAPQQSGTASGAIAFVSNASNSPTGEGLSGIAVPPPGTLSVSSTSVNFGSVLVGSTKAMLFTLTNSGPQGSAIQVSQIAASGQGFTVTGTAPPFSLTAGQSVTLNINFSPTASGNSSGSLQIASTATDSGVSAALSGTGVLPGLLSVSPGTMNFPSVTDGTSQGQTGTLTAGATDITVSIASWNGTGFSLGGITFPVKILAGTSTPFTVTFSPQQAGAVSGSVSFTSNASNSPSNVSLTGAGVQPVQHSVALSWNQDTSSVQGYYVYRGTRTGGPYTKISTLQTTTSYTDASVSSGQTYYYVVTALSPNSVESGYSNQVVATIP